METSWLGNKASFAKYGMFFHGYVCMSTYKGKKTSERYTNLEEYETSKIAIQDLKMSYLLLHSGIFVVRDSLLMIVPDDWFNIPNPT